MLEDVFGDEKVVINLLYYIGDHYQDYEDDCYSLMALNKVTNNYDQWSSTTFKFLFSKVPAKVIFDFMHECKKDVSMVK